ncbi:MAG: chemotaxis protein CheW [Promethearchaeota archaeon]
MIINASSLDDDEKILTKLPIVRFKIGSTSFGFDIERVLEILRMEPITRVPNVVDYIQGVINLRGQIVPIVNLRTRFSLPIIKKTPDTRILIITYGNESMGIVVDQVLEVANVPINKIIPKPRYFQSNINTTFLKGLAKFQKSLDEENDEIILLLNLPKIMKIEEESRYTSELEKIIKRKTKLLEDQRKILRKKLIAQKKRLLEEQKLKDLKNIKIKEKHQKKGVKNEDLERENKIEGKKNKKTEQKELEPNIKEVILKKDKTESIAYELKAQTTDNEENYQNEIVIEESRGDISDIESDDDIMQFLSQTETEYKEKKTEKKTEILPFKDSVYDMSEIQRSALDEVGNVCVGNAANALSVMIDKVVKISIPTSEIVESKQVINIIGSPEKRVVGVYIEISGEINMHILLILEKNAALRLTDTLMGTSRSSEELENQDVLSPMDESALMEVGNILGSHYLTALSNMTTLETTPSPPAISFDMLGAMVDSLIAKLIESTDIALVLNTIFYIEDQSMEGFFLIFPVPESIHKIFEKLELN